MKYQFHIDNRPAGPVRLSWREAARDAVNAGYAAWTGADSIAMDDTQGATIERWLD